MLVQVKGVTKKFGGLVALNQLDLQVEDGEILGVIGPNGAGKSTLLNIIAGVHRPTAGAVFYRYQKISGLNPDRICRMGIARTFQIPRPFSKMSAIENVLVAASFGNAHPGKSPSSIAEEVLAFVSFPTSPETPAACLTTAQLRRLDLARALASHPSVLLMDESAAGLTPNELTELQNLVFKIRDQGTTILIVEHIMRLIMRLCDRIVVLHYGEKIAEGSPGQIVNDEQVTAAYLGEKYLL